MPVNQDSGRRVKVSGYTSSQAIIDAAPAGVRRRLISPGPTDFNVQPAFGLDLIAESGVSGPITVEAPGLAHADLGTVQAAISTDGTSLQSSAQALGPASFHSPSSTPSLVPVPAMCTSTSVPRGLPST